jgi:hypothetical protein
MGMVMTYSFGCNNPVVQQDAVAVPHSAPQSRSTAGWSSCAQPSNLIQATSALQHALRVLALTLAPHP